MTGLSDVWGLEFALTNKADRRHSHIFTDIDGLLEAIQQIQGEGTGPQTLDISAVQGLSDALAGKANVAHEHTTSQVADLDNILIALQDSLSGKAATDHTHQLYHISNLQSALDGKAATSHTHSLATTSTAGFMSAEDKTKLNGLGGSNNPTIADVQGLQTALDGKSDTSHTHAGLPTASLSALTYTFSQSSVMAGATGSYANLTDGNSATGAGTDATGAFSWLKADLGANKIISRVKLWGGSIPGWGDTSVYLKGALLECSTDDTNWVILVPVLTGVVNANAVVFAVPPIQARYVRIQRPSYVGVTEFVIYGQ